MAAFSEMYAMVRGHTGGVPDFLVDDALASALESFCKGSDAWTSSQTETIALDTPIVATLPEGALLSRWLDVKNDDGDSIGTACWRVLDDDSVEVSSAWVDDELTLRCSLFPAAGVTEIDDTLFARYRRTLAYGTAAKLSSIDGKAWTNFKLSQWLDTQFEQGIRAARREILDNKRRPGRRQRNHTFY